MPDTQPTPPRNRRTFFAAAGAIVAGGIAVLTPVAVGVASFLTPLFRSKKSPTVRVALLSQVPDDGFPRSFPVVTDRQDAWTGYQSQKVGAVYLVRKPGEEKPTAFTAKCPHAGCFIGYTMGSKYFKCPCHTSEFNLDGSRVKGDQEVSPRGMDTLPVTLETIEGGEDFQDGDSTATAVLVEFIDYKTGEPGKIPTA